jgi:hypothetical protein
VILTSKKETAISQRERERERRRRRRRDRGKMVRQNKDEEKGTTIKWFPYIS